MSPVKRRTVSEDGPVEKSHVFVLLKMLGPVEGKPLPVWGLAALLREAGYKIKNGATKKWTTRGVPDRWALRLPAVLAGRGVEVSAEWLKDGSPPGPRKVDVMPPGRPFPARSHQDGQDALSVGDSPQSGAVSPGSGGVASERRTHIRRAQDVAGKEHAGGTRTKTAPSAQRLAQEAGEKVAALAAKLCELRPDGPKLLSEMLLRIAVDTSPDEIPEMEDFISLARWARLRWKEDRKRGNDGGDSRNPGSGKRPGPKK